MTDQGRYDIRHPLEDGPDLRLFALRRADGKAQVPGQGKAPNRDDEGPRQGQGSGQALALHLLDLDLSRPPDRRRLERLWDLRGRLLHPSLPPLVDLYWRGRRAGLVIPDLQRQEGMSPYPFDGPLEQRLTDALELAQLAVYLHGHGFLCGLFTPSKLWRGSDGILLNVVECEHPPNEGELPVGKSCYAAPEFLQGRAPDVLSDLYSLGLLLYHLLTGSPPFLEDDPQSLRQKQMMARPADPRSIEASLPQEAVEVLTALTQKERTLRPSSAVFAVTALRAACSSWGTTLPAVSRTPRLRAGLVGRQEERQRLDGMLDAYLEDGRPRVLAVRGGAGMGKALLLLRLRLLARLRRLSVHTSDAQGREHVAEESASEAKGAEHPTEVGPAPERQGGIPRPWQYLFEASQPQVVLCGSPPPRQVLDALLDSAAQSAGPLLAFEAEACDEVALAQSKEGLEVIRLEPLEEADCETLVTQALGRPLERRPLRRVLDQGGGNPHFLLESLRQMVSSGELRFQGGRWQRDPSARPADGPPSSLLEMLRRQVDALPPFRRRLVQILAVAEDPLSLPTLGQVAGSPASRCEDALRALRDAQLVRLSGSLRRSRGSLHYGWSARCLASALDDETRRNIHLGLAQSYSAVLDLDPSAADWAAALKHSLGARQRDEVNRLLKPTLEALLSHSKLAQAAQLLQQAADSGLAEEPGWKLRLRQANLLFRCGELERCLTLGGDLLDHPELGDPVRRAPLLALLARAGLLRGEGSRALQRLEDALRLLDGGGPLDLDNAVRGELLAALSYRGRRRKARPLARHLMRERDERRGHPAYDKVCHALFLYFHLLQGERRRAVAWEVRSIRLAMESGQDERALGRLLGLALVHADQGSAARAEAILRYVQGQATLRRHAEAGLFARLAKCLLLRRRGQHRTALSSLDELKARNRRANRSRNLGSALHIELARNFNHLLQPQKALESLQRSRRLRQREDKFEDVLDSLAEEARAWLVLGQPDQARQVLQRSECSLPSPRLADLRLLRARLCLLEGDRPASARWALSVLERAELESFTGGRGASRPGVRGGLQGGAWAEFLGLSAERPHRAGDPPSATATKKWRPGLANSPGPGEGPLPAVALEAALILARTRLLDGDAGPAQRLARQAWRQAVRLDDDPLAAESLLLLSQIALQDGSAKLASVLARRGLQICRRLQSPALGIELLRHLGRALASRGRTDRALSCFSQALQVLKEALFHLSTQHRRAFSRLHLEPLEEERSQILDRHDRPEEGRHLAQIRRWMAALDSAPDPRRWARLLLQAVAACIPAAGRVFLAPQAGSEPIPIASHGQCRHDGRALLRDPSSNSLETLRWRDQGVLCRLGIPLSHPLRGEGLLYLECPRQAVSENEIDYLLCLTSCLEMHWEGETAGLPPGKREEAAKAQAQASPSRSREGRSGTSGATQTVAGAHPTSDGGRSLARPQPSPSGGAPEIIASHPRMRDLLDQVRRIASTLATVLISGESGTGKELVARALHHSSSRRSGPFVAVNCSGLPESLIESELFGHARGAFTGASQDKRGLFEAASGGTLFLDEIASMPAGLQQTLLRALQEKSIRRVGETQERIVDVRVAAATNQPLPKLVSQGEFRADLYHRLNVCHLQIPPLRRRGSDIALLAEHRLARLCREEGRNVRLSPEALQLLASYHFPGNVRELHNLVDSAFYLARGRTIQADDLRPRLQHSERGESSERHQQVLQQMLSGDRDFWQAVREPFLERDLSRPDVRRIVGLGLARSEGSYRKLTALFNLPANDYKRFMSFLAHHGCKVDFRPYRKAAATES